MREGGEHLGGTNYTDVPNFSKSENLHGSSELETFQWGGGGGGGILDVSEGLDLQQLSYF